MRFTRYILTLLFFSIFLFSFPSKIDADILNPEYMDATCNSGEVMIECQNGHWYPIRGKNECIKYENNSSYRFLGEDHGTSKYCYTNSTSNQSFNLPKYVISLLSLIFVTILFELPIFLIFGFRSGQNIRQIIIANLISVITLNLLTGNLPYSSLLIVVLLELGVIVFESIFLAKTVKSNRTAHLVASTVVANVISATLGYAVYASYISGLIK